MPDPRKETDIIKINKLKGAIHSFLIRHLSIEDRQRIKKLLFLEKKIKYDAAAQWAIQDDVCNLNCAYCRFPHSKKEVPSADAKSLSKALDKTGKIFNVEICGNGETFLVPNIIEACLELTKKHYIGIVTNLTSGKVREFCDKIDPKKVTSIIASLHIKELERTGLMGAFIENFLLCKKKGFNIRAQEVAYPELLGEIGRYKAFFEQRNIQLYFAEYFGSAAGKSYPEDYTDQERFAFGLVNKKQLMELIYQKGKLCNAAYNVCTVANDGKVYPCPGIKEVLGDISGGEIKFKKELTKCPNDRCDCPLNFQHYALFMKALKESKNKN